jgi:putative ABC transport system ATP-binding protein
MPAVVGEKLSKIFARRRQVVALKDADVAVEEEIVALMDPADRVRQHHYGRLSLIDPADDRIRRDWQRWVFEGARVLTDDRQLRRKRMGIIFQAYNLIPFLTSVENIALVLTLNGISRREAMARANELLNRLELGHRAETYPATLSGGEQQRVAVARAVINDPAVILADEPLRTDTERGDGDGSAPATGTCEVLRSLVTHDENDRRL